MIYLPDPRNIAQAARRQKDGSDRYLKSLFDGYGPFRPA